MPNPDLMRRFAEFLERNGLGGAFIALSLLLLFAYFGRMIFRPTYDSLLHEIKVLLVEIKTLLKKE